MQMVQSTNQRDAMLGAGYIRGAVEAQKSFFEAMMKLSDAQQNPLLAEQFRSCMTELFERHSYEEVAVVMHGEARMGLWQADEPAASYIGLRLLRQCSVYRDQRGVRGK
ncbi:hypothetical protein [Hydrocarboniphaga effusa]|uniref:hypothetical protein n=1 Tax=Hydrocarboniphaga effusa TaxID=243629 RepID=UPI0012FB5A62|nr:hypothetical protein [Hydrocarboniphaga effusa]